MIEPIQHTMEMIPREMGVVLSTTIVRLVVAALLGGTIGLERELRHKPAGLRTNLFICFGAALFTVLSSQLAGTPGEASRIASNIITGIGFIGAGSILHSRGSVTGLTTAATIFVTAAVGMAAGGGLYITAVFATVVILVALAVLGKLEASFEIKSLGVAYEVWGPSTDAVLHELNRILDEEGVDMQDVHAAPVDGHSRVVFTAHCVRSEHESLNIRLHQSSIFARVQTLGRIEHE
jgi:putative Mg2+ transporter-C (MgtC) family protein